MSGRTDWKRPAAPETMAAATDVPLMLTAPVVDWEVMNAPGAAIPTDEPRLEKSARLSELVVAATAVMPVSEAGSAPPASIAELPAAAMTIAPFDAA